MGVAVRGIDIGKLTRVFNYDLLFKPEEYIHRISLTGHLGAAGQAISLVTWDDFKKLCAIGSELEHLIERRDVAEFRVRKTVPIFILNYVPKNQRSVIWLCVARESEYYANKRMSPLNNRPKRPM